MKKIEITSHLTQRILIALILGATIGLVIKPFSDVPWVESYVIGDLLHIGGSIFLTIMKMLVVPVVFISLVTGTATLHDGRKLGRFGIKTLALYFMTTAIAITLALTVANLLQIGDSQLLTTPVDFKPQAPPPFRTIITGLIPSNSLEAMVKGDMLQVIVFSILFGSAIAFSGKAARPIAEFFIQLNTVIMRLVLMVMTLAPYGVFCLMATLFATMGFDVIIHLANYFATVLLVLLIHVVLTNSCLLKLLARVNPLKFFKKMYTAMLFAFSVSSSNASIPVVLETVEDRLGVNNPIAAFVIPLGATINMDGTAIMQGVATVFIAHVYGIAMHLMGYLMVILTATLASIGTAGVPGVGMITLAMVLQQAGLPLEGISLVIGIDRLLDMARTAVNITGDAAVACVVAASENELDHSCFTNSL